MPQVEDYIPYVYKDADDIAKSWDLVIDTYKRKLDELGWHKLSIEEQKLKFASFAEIARDDPERYIKDIALYVEAIIHKTVYIIVKQKYHGRSAKEVANAAMDVINMVALNTRTIANIIKITLHLHTCKLTSKVQSQRSQIATHVIL